MDEVSRLRRSDGPRGEIFMRSHADGKLESRIRLEPVGCKLFEEARWVITATLVAPPDKSHGGCVGEGDGNRFKNQS